jgi:pilus assembly protein CpaE
MKVLLASSTEAVTEGVFDTIGNAKNGCTELVRCDIEQSSDRVAQVRPDVVIIEVGSGKAEATSETIREIQETQAVRVLAIGPSNDAQLILQTLKEGAYKYVGIERIDGDLPAALRCVRQEPPLMMQRGRVIGVVGASGGCGASTISVNIAAAYCRRQQRCILVDLNLQGGDLAVLLRLQPSHSIADLCQNVDRIDASLFESCLVAQEQENGVALLPPPLRYQDIAKVTARGIRKAITVARSQYPYVVVDVDRSYRHEHAQALFQSDVIVLVVRLDFSSIRQAGRILAYFDDLGIGRDRVRLVVNRTTAKSDLRERDVESALKLPLSISIPEGAKDLGRAAHKGVPLVVDYPRSRVAQKLTDLAVSLNGKL